MGWVFWAFWLVAIASLAALAKAYWLHKRHPHSIGGRDYPWFLVSMVAGGVVVVAHVLIGALALVAGAS